MKEQSGRSLIEIVGVLAIGVIMIASAYNMYRSIDQRQKRMIAYEDVKEIDCTFTSLITKISVEMIGEHEESIIIIEKQLEAQ
jgi:hypothetical protein